MARDLPARPCLTMSRSVPTNEPLPGLSMTTSPAAGASSGMISHPGSPLTRILGEKRTSEPKITCSRQVMQHFVAQICTPQKGSLLPEEESFSFAERCISLPLVLHAILGLDNGDTRLPHGPLSPMPAPICLLLQILLAGQSARSGRCPSLVCISGKPDFRAAAKTRWRGSIGPRVSEISYLVESKMGMYSQPGRKILGYLLLTANLQVMAFARYCGCFPGLLIDVWYPVDDGVRTLSA